MNTENDCLNESMEAEIRSRGLDPGTVKSQIETFRKGIKPQELARPCTLGDGIESVGDNLEQLSSLFDQYCGDKNIVKFVPASGAASRMFKELQAALSSGEVTRETLQAASDSGDKEGAAALKFIEGIERYAFYKELASSLESEGIDMKSLLREGSFREIIGHTLGEPGLNYSNLPKGIIKFHLYGDYPRTAFEEHLVEAAHYSIGAGGVARLHFTLSAEHEGEVKSLISRTKFLYESEGVSIEASYSVQKPSTDTIAVDLKNKPFRDSEGNLLFRPGGHGALIENLNDLECDMVFIKNIDNVVPDRIKGETYTYKKALGGYLIELETRVFSLLRELDGGYSEKAVNEALTELSAMGLLVELPEYLDDATQSEKAMYVRARLMSPIRVCGVVRNQGEPGGGPFWVRGFDGSLSKQIVESSQVNMDDPTQKALWESSTHFNPVDLVCSVRDYEGSAFDLTQYIDRDAGFISHKSSGGRDLKALELPGLWNGAMAYWNTVFVEVPLITFNPVKTVLDLLRPEHQNP